jgi:hypothetical protein
LGVFSERERTKFKEGPYPPLPGLLTEDPELLLPEEELPLLLLLDDGV